MWAEENTEELASICNFGSREGRYRLNEEPAELAFSVRPVRDTDSLRGVEMQRSGLCQEHNQIAKHAQDVRQLTGSNRDVVGIGDRPLYSGASGCAGREAAQIGRGPARIWSR